MEPGMAAACKASCAMTFFIASYHNGGKCAIPQNFTPHRKQSVQGHGAATLRPGYMHRMHASFARLGRPEAQVQPQMFI